MYVSLLILGLIDSAFAHGYMTSPKIRGERDYAKREFWAKVDDTGNRCPGFAGKHFGIEPNSKFSPYQAYKTGGSINIKLTLKTLHQGPIWIEYACMDGHESEAADSARATWTKLPLVDGTTVIKSGRCIKPSDIATCPGDCFCKFPVKAPMKNCNHGLLVSLWHNIDNYPNEVFKHCADIRITGSIVVPPSSRTGSSSAFPTRITASDERSEDAHESLATILSMIGCCVLAICIAIVGYYFYAEQEVAKVPHVSINGLRKKDKRSEHKKRRK